MAHVPIVLRDGVEDVYLVSATVARDDALRAIEALTHTTGDGLYRYTGLATGRKMGSDDGYHRFAFDGLAYAWLIGAKP